MGDPNSIMIGSAVFAQMTLYTLQWATQTASWLVQPFLHRWPQSVCILYNGTPFPLIKVAPSHGGIWTAI